MMQQYMDIKSQYDDAILFFRLGDFYEMFFEDAKLVSRLLELTLTGKQCGLEERAPMCGVPFHAADSYISKLVNKGYKVAICEQLEDPALVKGMVKRGVIKVVTPGTVTSDASLNEKENNYLASAYLAGDTIALSYCDVSTGELRTTEFEGQGVFDRLINELVKISAKELLINEDLSVRFDEAEIASLSGSFVRTMSGSYYSRKSSESAIRAQFGGVSLTALGLEGREAAVIATGSLLSYLLETQKQEIRQITGCAYYDAGSGMSLDKASIRNLELTETLYDKKNEGSLLWVLDKTNTAMGGRTLKRWIIDPLTDPAMIRQRLNAVSYFVDHELDLNDVTDALRSVYDFERLTGKMASGSANGRDMIALSTSIKVLPEIRSSCEGALAEDADGLLASLYGRIRDLSKISDMIDDAIVDDPPVTITDGSLIKGGFSEELDELKGSIKDAKTWIAGLERAEKERTGITHLKVGYNKVFGYYIEISRSNLDMVPEDYIRKQTLVGAERFITPKLKEMESKVLNAETKINKLEYDIFSDLRKTITEQIEDIQTTSKAIAEIDVLASLAKVAVRSSYVKPEVDTSGVIEIERGRHPVIEKMDMDGQFVANDTYVDSEGDSLLMITGPNMAGKSTYMRQTALIVLMAQMGSFVPADRARIGVVDRIFTRIGASDNLSQGQSTFFVEMSELAYILKNATENSLIILDEIGRGTSTYDGLSIAWATVERLCPEGRRTRTMFATHYHELTSLENELPGVKNLNIDVSDENGKVVFLHSIIPGPANKSYGVHVARLAGVPNEILESAEVKLAELEDGSKPVTLGAGRGSGASGEEQDKKQEPEQISFFGAAEDAPAVKKLKSLDLMDTKPSEALRILEELKDLAEKDRS